MAEFGWTWQELQATPFYVRRYSWDLMLARREAEAEAVRRAGQSEGADHA